MRIRFLVGCLILAVACGKKQAEAPPPESQVLVEALPWTWHTLGKLAVIEGEVREATDLTLKGRSIEAHRFAEVGLVRWELFRPPEGETAVLLDGNGRQLAQFTFSEHPVKAPAAPKPAPLPKAVPPPKPQPAPQPRPQPAPKPVPAPKSLPVPQPKAVPPPKPEPPPQPAPQAKATARMESRPVGPYSTQRAPAPSPIPGQAAPYVQPPPPAQAKATARMDIRPVGPYSAQRSPAPSAIPGQVAPYIPPPAQAKTTARMDSHPVGPYSAQRSPAPSPIPGQVAPYIQRPAPSKPEPRPEPLPAALPVHGGVDWPGAGEALNLTRGRSGHKQILLSFDGGSNAAVASEVLDLLKARGVRTTFFLTGTFIQHFPAVVRRMAAEGHELGNHTMNHPHFAPGMKRDPRWTRERIQKEMLDADAALVKLIGRPMDPVWRAPYGEHTAEIRRWAEEMGYRHVGWSEGADTLDWATPKERKLYRTGEAIVHRLEQRLNRDGDGLIVLMHLGSERAEGDRPTEGLGAFMDRARSAGWSFVPVSAYLRDMGKPAWDGRRRMALLNGQPQETALNGKSTKGH